MWSVLRISPSPPTWVVHTACTELCWILLWSCIVTAIPRRTSESGLWEIWGFIFSVCSGCYPHGVISTMDHSAGILFSIITWFIFMAPTVMGSLELELHLHACTHDDLKKRRDTQTLVQRVRTTSDSLGISRESALMPGATWGLLYCSTHKSSRLTVDWHLG